MFLVSYFDSSLISLDFFVSSMQILKIELLRGRKEMNCKIEDEDKSPLFLVAPEEESSTLCLNTCCVCEKRMSSVATGVE